MVKCFVERCLQEMDMLIWCRGFDPRTGVEATHLAFVKCRLKSITRTTGTAAESTTMKPASHVKYDGTAVLSYFVPDWR
jgi:hypothetical protein